MSIENVLFLLSGRLFVTLLGRFGRQLQLLVAMVPGCESCLLNAANVLPTLSSSFEVMRSPQTSADGGVTSPSCRSSQTLLSRVLEQLKELICILPLLISYAVLYNCHKHTEIHAFLHCRLCFYTASPPKQLNLHLYTSESLLSTSINATVPNNAWVFIYMHMLFCLLPFFNIWMFICNVNMPIYLCWQGLYLRFSPDPKSFQS